MSVELNLKDKLNFEPDDLRSPAVILQEFADKIRADTNGLVVPAAEHHDKAPGAWYEVAEFWLSPRSLSNYKYKLMEVWYRIGDTYDVVFHNMLDGIAEEIFAVESERATSGNDFKEKASKIITCPRAVKLMNGIIQMARAKTASDTPDITITATAEPAPPNMTGNMTAEEAVQILNDAQFADEFQGDERVATAFFMARDALIQQIPKMRIKAEPLKEDVKIGALFCKKGTSVLSTCPECGGWLRPKQKYCSDCGQALKWEE